MTNKYDRKEVNAMPDRFKYEYTYKITYTSDRPLNLEEQGVVGFEMLVIDVTSADDDTPAGMTFVESE
jgi:hypothetical protein